ncbi:fibronectin type III domain-containing protein [Zeaxanthinibacter sp. PT1]|uniref:fibronectin type III domain-containing protein n=1 Tax=Zeaxanthinibacter TaxID=561554 RepID=UPI002349A555|nr:fibronectin type III domain-containing protein [Zeaxanthinibacter sp. PT1]MDC6352366.1 fibronectin type III domain-containing protein [Zeaxanthinibacter sp. PT1]
MKKNSAILIISLILLSACEGEFVESDMAINLVSPIDNETCYDGISVPGNLLDIPFRWSAQGQFQDFELHIDAINSNKEVINPDNTVIKTVNSGETQTMVRLNYGQWYQWKVKGNGSESISSKEYTFFSQGIPDTNTAPAPAVIQVVSNSAGTLQFTWQRPDDPDNSVLVYDVYFDDQPNPTTQVESNITEIKTVEMTGLQVNKEYYIKVITKENPAGNSSTSILKVTAR